jgi:hypothetical protein
MEPKVMLGLRVSLGLLASMALVLAGARGATAGQDHFLVVSAGNEGDSTAIPTETHVYALDQHGVAGVDPGSFKFEAEADSDSGVIAVEALFDVGPGLPVVDLDTAAAIEQWLLIDPGAGPLTATFRLLLSASAEILGTGLATFTGRLHVGSACRVSVQVSANEDPVITDGCSGSFGGGNVVYAASAGLDQLMIVVSYATGFVPTTVDITAQLETHFALAVVERMSASGSGVLSIELEGADEYHFTSPTFLTVPEPATPMLGLAAAASLGRLARRRRCARGSTGRDAERPR